MMCPQCGQPTYIKDSRGGRRDCWRRRHCSACPHRFSTIEVLVGAEDVRRIKRQRRAAEEGQ